MKYWKNSVRRDESYIKQLLQVKNLDPGVDLYIRHYLLYAMKKCKHSKCLYYTTSFCTILIPIILAFLQYLDCDTKCLDYITVGLTSFSALCAASLSLFKFHEKWTRNRQYIEKALSCINSALYIETGLNDSERQQRLLELLDNLNAENQGLWEDERKHDSMHTSENAEKH